MPLSFSALETPPLYFGPILWHILAFQTNLRPGSFSEGFMTSFKIYISYQTFSIADILLQH